jgi:PEP-CTERM motif
MKTPAFRLVAFSLLAVLLAVTAHGEEFVFNFNSYIIHGGPTVQGSGVFTAHWLTGNEWQITGVQGTMNGGPLTLAATSDEGVPDFLFYTGLGSGGYNYGFPFDLSGVGLSNGQISVILACGSISYYLPDCELEAPYPYDTNGLDFSYQQVPEPAVLNLVAVGLVALAVCGQRRRRA